jgi:PQQ-dependent dehydrogenase (s-GDH family)
VWYRFVAQSSNPTITLTNIGSAFSAHGAKLELLTGCTAASSITCGGTVLTALQLTIGTTYTIRVYSTAPSAVPAANGGFTICIATPQSFSRTNEVFQQTILSGPNLMNDPWEITYGPDDYLWITEAKGYKVSRMDPATGARTVVLDISNGAAGYLTAPQHTAFNMQFNIGSNNPQGGLAGLALHPDWGTKKYVYVSYVHSYNSTSTGSAGIFYTNRIVRFTFNTTTNKLESPVSLCDTIPGSSDHNSQRMIIAPVAGINYLFYAAGDMGAGQFGNATRLNKAQIATAYEGKILRFNLEADTDAGTLDKWIPGDNPYNTTAPAKQSAVWCTGIRNNQGFAYGNGRLYGSSHGPYSDDEINIIQRAKNYGHPQVIGFADGNYDNSKAGHDNGADVTSLPLITNEAAHATAISNYADPMFSAYDANQATVNSIYNNPVNNGSWPSEGWSGMELYDNTVIPGWKNSLLLSSLKWGRVLRLKLNGTGSTVMPVGGSDTLSYFGSRNRYRDVAVAPDGRDLFVVMDKSETSSGPSAANPTVSACNGCVQKYTFMGYNKTAGNRSMIPATVDVAAGIINSCATGSTIVINSAHNNTTIWVPITGPDGNIVAEINANGNNLDTINASFYVKSGTVREDGSKRLYLNRNLTITPQVQPASAVDVRLYITKGELDALRSATNSAGAPSGVTGISDLAVFKNNDACGAAFSTASTKLTPTYAELHGTNGYVLNVSTTSFSTFYFARSSFIILPMKLVSFEGVLEKGAVQLQWRMEHESNNALFNIERSTDGLAFETINTVDAKGNASHTYGYRDQYAGEQLSAFVYYRLKITGADGGTTYSPIISFTLGAATTFNIYPNPVKELLKLELSLLIGDDVQVQVTDIQGRVVYIQERFRESGLHQIDIDVKEWPAQTYSVKVSSPRNKISALKSVIKL